LILQSAGGMFPGWHRRARTSLADVALQILARRCRESRAADCGDKAFESLVPASVHSVAMAGEAILFVDLLAGQRSAMQRAILGVDLVGRQIAFRNVALA